MGYVVFDSYGAKSDRITARRYQRLKNNRSNTRLTIYETKN